MTAMVWLYEYYDDLYSCYCCHLNDNINKATYYASLPQSSN